MKIPKNQSALLSAISNGDEEAFTVLYELHWEKLFIYVMNVIKDEEETADIIQELFLNLWLSREKANVIQNIQAYLFIAARNAALQRLAARQKKDVLLQSLQIDLNSSSQTAPDKILFGKELAEIIDQAVSRLPKKMREVFVLSRERDLTHREIADLLSISDKTVKKQVGYAIKIIKASIKAKALIFVITLTILF